MTAEHTHNPSDAERYTDGAMTPDEAAAFEARLQSDDQSRREVESLRAVDERIQRRFGGHCDAQTPLKPVIPQRPRRSRVAGWGALAAALLLVVAIGAVALLSRPTSAERLYHAQIRDGFTPMWVCDTDREFAVWTNNRLRTPLIPAESVPENARQIGWSIVTSDSPLGEHAPVMLATWDAVEVLVLVDRAERDRDVRVSLGSDLRIFRRELGPVVMYEITPLGSAHLLDTLRLAPESALRE